MAPNRRIFVFGLVPPGSLAAGAAIVILSLACAGLNAATPSVLTSIYAIKHLTPAEAARRHPVCLRAVVTYNKTARDGNVYCIQNSTGGIFLEAPDRALTGKPGDIVEVRGLATASTGYAPAVVEPVIRVIGKARLPRPVRLSFSVLSSGASDGLFVTVSGVVRSVATTDGSPTLRLDTGNVVVDVFVPEMTRHELEGLGRVYGENRRGMQQYVQRQKSVKWRRVLCAPARERHRAGAARQRSVSIPAGTNRQPSGLLLPPGGIEEASPFARRCDLCTGSGGVPMGRHRRYCDADKWSDAGERGRLTGRDRFPGGRELFTGIDGRRDPCGRQGSAAGSDLLYGGGSPHRAARWRARPHDRTPGRRRVSPRQFDAPARIRRRAFRGNLSQPGERLGPETHTREYRATDRSLRRRGE